MTRRPTIFISHKTGDGPHADLRQALVKRLEEYAGRLDVFYDQSAEAGTRVWDELKDKALARCASFICLVDDKALNSDYVRNEITIICSHHATKPGLCIVPVYAPGFTRKDLGNYRDIKVTRFQSFTAVEYHGRTIDAIVENIFVAAKIETLAIEPDSDTEYWIEQLEGHLPKSNQATQRILQALWSTNDSDVCIQSMSPESRVLHIARGLINLSDVRKIFDVVVHVAAASSNGSKLLGLLAPLCFPAAIADELRARAIAKVQPGPAVLLSADEPETGFQVVRRAFRCAPEYHWEKSGEPKPTHYLYLGARESTVSGTFSDIRHLLDAHILAADFHWDDPPSDPDSLKELVMKSAANVSRKPKVFIVPLWTYQYKPDLHDRYPGIAVLVLRNHAETSYTPEPPLAAINPDLTRDTERAGLHHIEFLRSRLAPLSQHLEGA